MIRAVDRNEKLLLSVVEAPRRLSVGRALMYDPLCSGQVTSAHVGRLRRVLPVALDALVAGLR